MTLTPKTVERIESVLTQALKDHGVMSDGSGDECKIVFEVELIASKLIKAMLQSDEVRGLIFALSNMTEHYVQLAGCGDCGFWEPETEPLVMECRAVLKSFTASMGDV
jgi:hypothetical protein